MKTQSKIFSPNKTLNVAGRLIAFDRPKVMGIMNMTPDSFYARSRYNADSLLDNVEQMIREGADFIDIGGYSSRPGAIDITTEEEIQRVVPVIKAITKIFPEIIISIDTFRAEVAKQAIDVGATIVNDISSGLLDNNMLEVVANSNVPYIMMHMKGNPQTMNTHSQYENVTQEVINYFHERIETTRALGIKDVIIDPGFGFAKTMSQNFELMRNLGDLHILEKPLLVGISRKSLIWKSLQITADNALNGTTALNTFALLQGANIIRVHDVKEAVECCKLMTELHSLD